MTHDALDTDCAYAAGLFDGEGTLYIDKNGRINMAVEMTDTMGVDKLYTIFGGFRNKNGYALKSGRQAHQWRTAGQRTVDVAGAMLPYSTTKRQQLEVLLSYAERYPVRDGRNKERDDDGRFTSPDIAEEMEVRQVAAQQLRALREIDPEPVIYDIETMGLEPAKRMILSCSFQYGDAEDEIRKSWRVGVDDEERMLLETREILEAAPWTMGFNSIRFDTPFIDTRLAIYGHRAMFLGSHVDVSEMYKTLTGRKKRTSLSDMSNELGLTDESAYKTPIDWDIWGAAHEGDQEALDYVLKHGDMDVILTKRAYDAIIKAWKKEYVT